MNDRWDSDPLIQVPEREPDPARNEIRANNILVIGWLIAAILVAFLVVRGGGIAYLLS